MGMLESRKLDLEGLRNLASVGGISKEQYEKIVGENPKRAYAL